MGSKNGVIKIQNTSSHYSKLLWQISILSLGTSISSKSLDFSFYMNIPSYLNSLEISQNINAWMTLAVFCNVIKNMPKTPPHGSNLKIQLTTIGGLTETSCHAQSQWIKRTLSSPFLGGLTYIKLFNKKNNFENFPILSKTTSHSKDIFLLKSQHPFLKNFLNQPYSLISLKIIKNQESEICEQFLDISWEKLWLTIICIYQQTLVTYLNLFQKRASCMRQYICSIELSDSDEIWYWSTYMYF